MLEPLRGLGRSLCCQSRLASPSSWTQPKQDLVLGLLGLANGRGHVWVRRPQNSHQRGAWGRGSGMESLDLSGHHSVNVGGAQLRVFQTQGTMCAWVPGPWDWLKACLKCLSVSPINLCLGFVLSSSSAFRVRRGGTVRSYHHAKVSVTRLESKAVAWEWRSPLFSKVFPPSS